MVYGMEKVRRGYEKYGQKFFFDDKPGANSLLWNQAYIGLPQLYLHFTMFFECLDNLTTEE